MTLLATYTFTNNDSLNNFRTAHVMDLLIKYSLKLDQIELCYLSKKLHLKIKHQTTLVIRLYCFLF